MKEELDAIGSKKDELYLSLRIVWAVAAKDIVDAVKNKTTISVIIGVALLMLSSQAMPLLVRLSDMRRLIVYDAGESQLVGQLRRNRQVSLIRVSSRQEMEDTLSEVSGAALGLVVPANFEQTADGGYPELDGYYIHWVGPSDATSEQAFFEAQLSQLAGAQVRINIEGNAVYPSPDADGQPFMVSLSLAIAIITISGFLVPYLIIEEKESKTMDALLISPASISEIVVGKAIAGMVYGLVASAVVFAFNRALVVHWGWAVLAALCGTLFAVALGLLLGSVFYNPQNMSLWFGAVFGVLLMPLFLSISAVSLPQWLEAIVPWVPSAALARVFRISLSGQVPVDRLVTSLAVVMGCAVLLLGAVVWIVRRSDR